MFELMVESRDHLVARGTRKGAEISWAEFIDVRMAHSCLLGLWLKRERTWEWESELIQGSFPSRRIGGLTVHKADDSVRVPSQTQVHHWIQGHEENLPRPAFSVTSSMSPPRELR